jgi:hypothetical protein
MTDYEKQKLLDLLDSFSKKLVSLEQKITILERENFQMAQYVSKLEGRINELESDSDI